MATITIEYRATPEQAGKKLVIGGDVLNGAAPIERRTTASVPFYC
jgi:hypothetical protein